MNEWAATTLDQHLYVMKMSKWLLDDNIWLKKGIVFWLLQALLLCSSKVNPNATVKRRKVTAVEKLKAPFSLQFLLWSCKRPSNNSMSKLDGIVFQFWNNPHDKEIKQKHFRVAKCGLRSQCDVRQKFCLCSQSVLLQWCCSAAAGWTGPISA